MSLKSIFELALTTDKRYNTGDISEKTGLQKQPDGSWKPPKAKGVASKKTTMTEEKKQKWEADAKNSTIATLKNKIKAMEDAKGINPHAEEIINIYKKELKEKSPNSEKVYNDKSLEPINKSWAKSDVVTSVPEGWKRDEKVTTVPNGYVAITNGKSRFGEGGRETKIIKEEDFKKEEKKSEKWKHDYKSYLPKKNEQLREMYLKEKDPKTKQAIKKALQEQSKMLPSDSACFTGDTKIIVKK